MAALATAALACTVQDRGVDRLMAAALARYLGTNTAPWFLYQGSCGGEPRRISPTRRGARAKY